MQENSASRPANDAGKRLARSRRLIDCPACLKSVPADACKCRFCGEPLDGKESPVSYLPRRSAPSKLALALMVVATFEFIIALVIIFTPGVPSTRDEDRDAHAIALLHDIHSAQHTYYAVYRTYGSRESLEEMELIPNMFSSEFRMTGCFFSIEKHDSESWSATACPESPGPRARSYHIDQTGIVRFSPCPGPHSVVANEESEQLK